MTFFPSCFLEAAMTKSKDKVIDYLEAAAIRKACEGLKITHFPEMVLNWTQAFLKIFDDPKRDVSKPHFLYA